MAESFAGGVGFGSGLRPGIIGLAHRREGAPARPTTHYTEEPTREPVVADSGIEVPYNQHLKPLDELLARVRRPGDFFVHGSIESPLPQLDIDGIGTVSFPVPPQQAKALVALCESAPYGRGQETLVDTRVRKVWQLAPSKLRLAGKAWLRTVDQILATVAEGLGCGSVKVRAELYKLLVYDRGSFFKPHRDTEKADGMFGTLLIVLPSAHAGGELVVRHSGREARLDLSGANVSEFTFAAFYADCEHEVLPVTRGHRVCLVYNLLLERRPAKRNELPRLTVPDRRAEVVAAAELLTSAFRGPEAPPKLVWLLEHQYSPAGLKFAALKNADAARAGVLREAAARTGCDVHLGIVHIGETGPAEYWGGSRGRSRRRGGYGQAYGDSDEVEVGSDDYEIVEVQDGWRYIDQWVSTEDRAAAFGEVPIGEGEVLPIGALDDEVPDEQRVMEATGNEGATFERTYHRAALVIWLRDRSVDVLLQAGVAGAVAYLDGRVSAWIDAGAAEAERPALLDEAGRIVAAWETGRLGDPASFDWRADDDGWTDEPEDEWEDEFEDEDEDEDEDDHEDGGVYSLGLRSPGRERPDRGRMVALLGALGDERLLERFVRGVLTARFDGGEAPALAEAAGVLGPTRAAGLLGGIVRERMRAAPQGCVKLLGHVIQQPRESDAERTAWLATARTIATACIEAVQTEKAVAIPGKSPHTSAAKRVAVSAETLGDLFDCLKILESPRLRAAATAAVAADGVTFDARTTIVPALRALRERGVAVMGDKEAERLWSCAAETLLALAGEPPAAPTDWRQDVRIGCKCEDCRELQRFARDPKAQVHRFRVRNDRRRHLHGQIARHGLDMTHVTERKGSPQTLVCTKTRRSYERKCAAYRENIVALGVLADLAGRPPKALAGQVERIAAALKRAASVGASDKIK